MSCDGKLVNSYTPNNNDKSPIVAFEIITCRELPDYDGGTIIEQVKTAEEFLNTDEEALDQPFYRVFAIYKKELNKSPKCFGDFYQVGDAIAMIEDLTGVSVYIYSY